MRVFLSNGYVDIDSILAEGVTFNAIVGGRGTGKTYGALRYALRMWNETGRRFAFFRRTGSQLDVVASEELSPFKKLVSDGEIPPVEVRRLSKYHVGFYLDDELAGYGFALTTIANLRGFDASDVDLIIYDEFIPERQQHKITGEADAFFNAYETINRNRELSGGAAVQALLLSNSSDLANPLFLSLGVVTAAQRLHDSKRYYTRLPSRELLLVDLKDSKISEAKKTTALYKLTSGTDFAAMAIDSDYSYNDTSGEVSRPLAEYTPAVFVGELAVYRHKSRRIYYVSSHRQGSAPSYTAGPTDLQRFRRAYSWLWLSYMGDLVEFEEYYLEALFTKYFSV